VLAVINDGKAFDEDDVWGICSVKTGRKKGKIGFFGIGFKAVFNITERPQIISGEFNFELKDYIYPCPIATVPSIAQQEYLAEKGAIFLLPYSGQRASRETLIENFGLIDDNLLLFLDSVHRLSFEDLLDQRQWQIEARPESCRWFQNSGREAQCSTVSLVNTLTGESKWTVFHKVAVTIFSGKVALAGSQRSYPD
jgi:hypothetical protein